MFGILGCGSSRKNANLLTSKPGLWAIEANGGASLVCCWSAATAWQLAHQRCASASPRRISAAAATEVSIKMAKAINARALRTVVTGSPLAARCGFCVLNGFQIGQDRVDLLNLEYEFRHV